jgi:putrescine transport system ATP-binding protein
MALNGAAARREGANGSRAVGAVRSTFAPWADPGAVPLLSIRRVTKRFGSVTAVDDLSLDIHEREMFSLLGPSGCGKTTLMRMLAGFETPDSGDILLGGQSMVGVPPHRRPVNMMFQSYALFPHMSVAGNVAYGLKQEGLPRGEIGERVAAILRTVKLEGMAERRPHQLSGGQRQRVALARALVKRPRLLLLDEPLGALDKKLREETQFELMDLQMQLGLTFIVVTHDQEEAMTLSDRIAVMDSGRLAQVATPAVLYEEPRTRAVAEFVGDITLFAGEVTARQGDLVAIASAEAGATLLDDAPDSPEPGQPVWLAVRPEKFTIRKGEPAGGLNELAGEVWDIAYLGDWTTYIVRLDSGKRVRVATANTRRHVADPIGWEDRVTVAFAPDAGVLLQA